MKHLWIPGVLPGMNELLDAKARNGGSKYNTMKKKWAETIAYQAMAQRFFIEKGGHFTYLVREPHAMRDPLNLCFGAIKFIEDALVALKRLENDGQKHVLSLTPHWIVDKSVQGVTLFVSDVGALTKEQAIAFDNHWRRHGNQKSREGRDDRGCDPSAQADVGRSARAARHEEDRGLAEQAAPCDPQARGGLRRGPGSTAQRGRGSSGPNSVS